MICQFILKLKWFKSNQASQTRQDVIFDLFFLPDFLKTLLALRSTCIGFVNS